MAQRIVYSQDSPKVVVALPDSVADGRAVVLCPGGGYGHAAKDKEADDWIPFFTKQGIAVATLKYDLPNGNRNIPLSQVHDVFTLLKKKAGEWNIDTTKIRELWVSSAGGHLASAYATHQSPALRPAFQIYLYPVIMLNTKRHQGMAKKFLGTQDKAEEDEWSSNLKVDSLQTPTFLALSADDKIIDTQNAINYYTAMIQHDLPASLHIYPDGGHGWGISKSFPHRDLMLQELTAWLKWIASPAVKAFSTHKPTDRK